MVPVVTVSNKLRVGIPDAAVVAEVQNVFDNRTMIGRSRHRPAGPQTIGAAQVDNDVQWRVTR
jgi:hypothetical protein